MALSTIDNNNKLVKYTTQLNREYVRENLFSPYMSEDINAIIRLRHELKQGGEQMNIPLVTKLTGKGKGSGTLVGNEEKIDNYGMRVWIDWARHAVATNKAQEQKDSADIFGEARPLLSDWGKELQRDELIEALLALPSEAAPAGLGSDDGDRVNGIRFQDATAAQRNAWNAANSDRVMYGALTSNYNATFATALANVDNTADKFTATVVSLMKRRARNATPKIRPYKLADGREYFVAFADSYCFRDLKQSLETINKDARPREADGMKNNPIFQDGDQIYDGVIVREIPEITEYVDNVWTTLKTGGAGGIRTAPVFLCGQQAATMAWGQMAKPTFRKEDDYGFVKGTGTEMAYGVSKMFKKTTAGDLRQWGVFTGFFASVADA
jgi:N4-gp56 family major capsid protein